MATHRPGGSPTVVTFRQKDPKEKVVKDPRAEQTLKSMYGRKARMLKRRFDRMGIPDGNNMRLIQFSPKHFAEAKRIGLTHIEDLRIVQ